MSLTTIAYGTTTTGEEAHLYLLANACGMTVTVTDLGACLVSARVRDAHGAPRDVVLGHTGLIGYENNPMGFGATVGRCANRIADASFAIGNERYRVEANEGANSLHSGPDMWFERMWELVDSGEDFVTLGLTSKDGDQGFPGNVIARATYQLSDDCKLTVRYEATAERPTIINMTNHTYFNLDGHAAGSILGHELQVHAKHYLPTHEDNIPTGEVAHVKGTPFDLRHGRILRDVLGDLERGYDHNFCLGTDGVLAHAAHLTAERSGIVLDVFTDAPGLQVYMAGWLDDMVGKDGTAYGRFAGVALETQGWPDAIHHSDWPSVVHGPEDPFAQTTVFAFSVA